MSEETYDGWSNWETWNANLWLGNDQGAYLATLEACENAIDGEREESWNWRAGDAIKEMVEMYREEMDIRLIGDEMSMFRVDWEEIATHFVDEIREGVNG